MGDIKLGYNTGYWSAGPPAGALDAVKAAFDSARGKSREEAEKILQGTAAARARLEAARKALRESIVGLLTAEQKASGCLPLG